MTNYAAPGARVGIQADSITITGGLSISFGRPAVDDQDPDGDPGETTAVQEGPVNVASGSDRVGIQMGGKAGEGEAS